MEKKARARDLLAQAQAASEKGRYDECRTCLRQAFQMDEYDPAFRKLVLSKLIDNAASAVPADWRQAETMVVEATSLQPDFAAPDGLLRAIADRKKDADVTECLAKAEKLRGEGDARSALAEVERGLRSYPNEDRLKKLRDKLAAQIRKERDRLVEELRRLDQSAKAARQAAEIEPLKSRAAAIAAGNQSDTELANLAAATIGNLEQRTKELRREHLRGLLVANRKGLLIAAGTAAAIFAGVLVVPLILRGTKEIPVTVTSDVAGASVVVGGRNCVTPNCALKLRPGTYTLRAAKDGYATDTRQVTIASGQAAVNLAVTLQPMPELLQVNTNFESGEVYLDNRRAGELRDGQYTASGTAPGEHTIRVTGGGAEFQARWKSELGAPPVLVGPIKATDVLATVVANAGAAGSVACNCQAQDIKVDGAAKGRTAAASGSPVALQELKEGARQIAVGDRSVVVDVRQNPALNVFLSLDRNVGVLIVETGQDQAKVFLNNRLFRRNTERGMLRIPLDVGVYTIRVEKDGFRSPAAQTVALKKGEEKAVTFALTAAPAYLDIVGAVAEAQVKVDGRPVGDTDRNGGFRHEIDPGSHTIEITKDDYVPVQVAEQFRPGQTTQLNRARVAMAKVVKTPPPPDPKRVEAQDWAQIANSTNPDDFDGFVRNHPGGEHVGAARTRAAELRQQAQANAARQAEQAAWDRVDKNNKGQLQDYLSHFSAGAHAQEANTRIADLDRQASAATAAAAAQRAKEQELAKAAADRAAVVKVLKDFEAAYNRRDLPALQGLWPETQVAAYRQQFNEARELQFLLQPSGTPVVAGDTATAICTRTLKYRGQSGPSRTASERVRVTLGRTAAGWVISSISLE